MNEPKVAFGVLVAIVVGLVGWAAACSVNEALHYAWLPTVGFITGMVVSLVTGPAAIYAFSRVSGIPWRRS